MIHHQKTVVEVLEQIKKMREDLLFECGDTRNLLDILIDQAEAGLYSKLSLTEVWSEKMKEAERNGLIYCIFKYEDKVYCSLDVDQINEWSLPEEVIL